MYGGVRSVRGGRFNRAMEEGRRHHCARVVLPQQVDEGGGRAAAGCKFHAPSILVLCAPFLSGVGFILKLLTSLYGMIIAKGYKLVTTFPLYCVHMN